MKEKDLIIFDIDRTIYDGSIGQDFIIELVNEGIISPKILATLSFELLEYELDLQNYSKTVKDALQSLSAELEGKDINKVKDVVKKVLILNHYKFYDFIFELPQVYKEFDYAILSLEPQILVSEISEFLKIPNYICNEFPYDKKIMKKPQPIETDKLKLLENSDLKNRNIIAAFGDSENDLEILNKAKLKIVINPTPNLISKIEKHPEFRISNSKDAFETFKKNIIQFI